ncbi:MAG: IS4 family transposase [Bacteroidota bacterium]
MSILHSLKEKEQSLKDRQYTEKESYKWSLGMQHSLPIVAKAQKRTFIFDAEADIKELWLSLMDLPTDAIIRLGRNRNISVPKERDRTSLKLLDYLDSIPVKGTYSLNLRALKRRNYSRNKGQNRAARSAQMELRFGPVSLESAPPHSKPLYLVEAKEAASSVPQGEDPIHWVLLTTHPVTSPQAAHQIIRWYEMRWTIEQVFRLSKRKGFKIESTELEYFDSIQKQAIATMEAAFRVMTLVLARDKEKGHPIEEGFTPSEIQCLAALNQKYQGRTQKQQNPYPPLQMSWAVWIIARLGGWKGGYGRRPPGPIIMKRGVEKFYNIFEGWSIQIDKEIC